MEQPTWDTSDSDAIRSPFNMEAVLASCPKLLAAWKRSPFLLTLAEDGTVLVVSLGAVVADA